MKIINYIAPTSRRVMDSLVYPDSIGVGTLSID